MPCESVFATCQYTTKIKDLQGQRGGRWVHFSAFLFGVFGHSAICRGGGAGGGVPSKESAKISNLPEMGKPISHNLTAIRFYDFHNSIEYFLWYSGIIIAQEGLPSACNPNLCSIWCCPSFRNMNMNRFQGIILVGPEVNRIRSDFKLLRHTRLLRLGKIRASDVHFSESAP